jgi:probable rRNA maturation factor
MILINNRQRKIKVDIKKLHTQAQKMLSVLGYSDFDLSVLLTTNKSIQKLNKTFRNKDKATDILSFPFHPDLKQGQKIKVTSSNDKNLGDIIISLERVQKDATEKWDRSFEHHLAALFAHGIAHLVGYNHHTDAEYEEMLKLEKRLLNAARSW